MFITCIIVNMLLWIGVAISMMLVLVPVVRFLDGGWQVRKQEFVNRIASTDISLYLKRYWSASILKNERYAQDTDQEKFSKIYNFMAGKDLYKFPLWLLAGCLFIFDGLVVSTAVRYGYEQYIHDGGGWVRDLTTSVKFLPIVEFDDFLLPFSRVDLTLPTMAAISGSYLYVFTNVIQGYRARTLLGSDLWWCSFRMLIAIPLGLSVSSLAEDRLGSFLAFGLGAFPMDAILKLLRRLVSNNLNATESNNTSDTVVNVLGVTADVAAKLAGEGVESTQQLVGVDPVSLALRAGLSFDYVVGIVSQAIAWKFLGSSVQKLAPLGLGDVGVIGKLIEDLDRNDGASADARAVITAAATAAGLDASVLQRIFRAISQDPYAIFLKQLS